PGHADAEVDLEGPAEDPHGQDEGDEGHPTEIGRPRKVERPDDDLVDLAEGRRRGHCAAADRPGRTLRVARRAHACSSRTIFFRYVTAGRVPSSPRTW